MDEMDARLGPRIAALRQPPRLPGDARTRLRARLQEAAAQRARSIVLSPLSAATAAVLIALATSTVWLTALRATAGSDSDDGLTAVQFVLHAEAAQSVNVVGDFNDWNASATPMERTRGGTWSAVVPLAPGPVTYSFLINGTEWRADPAATAMRSDFGRPSSITLVSAAEADQ